MGSWTTEGANISVMPSSELTIAFENVISAGITTVNITDVGPNPPSGFNLAGNYYDIKTTAEYIGNIRLQIVYDDSNMTLEEEMSLRLMQWDDGLQQWVDITTSSDIENNILYGETSHLSVFAIFTTMLVHNIAINDITFSKQYPTTNETIYIYVTIENRGTLKETFDVSVNYTLIIDPLIGTETITLQPGESITLSFTWTPTTWGRYEIKVYTSQIPDDIDPSDNVLIQYIYVCSGSDEPGGTNGSRGHYLSAERC
jgi:hypothetical protein